MSDPAWLKAAKKNGLEINAGPKANAEMVNNAVSKGVNTGLFRDATWQPLPPDCAEEEFQKRVVDFATMHGWMVYHTRDSRGSQEGFPDLVLVRGSKLYFVELKKEDGVESKAQKKWAEALATVCPKYVWHFLWRPSHWPFIEKLLSTPED